ncbi:glycosyltransferase family 2 protein [Lichenicoccus sp.]|uniref:glycosyltransferase family 2 protein n=1 Tax=Lichenicoccus sp. TaxID=2781899 RepID=UPI003D12B47C
MTDTQQAAIGIGIITYNRLDKLKRAMEAVRRHTSMPFSLVVADDGSSDGTASFLEADGVARITGRNMGVSWNKNRLLWFMTNTLACDGVLLLEDDCHPQADGWQRDWMEAVRRHGHINLAGGWFEQHFRSGSGRPDDPVECRMISGQCVGYSRRAIQRVGYFDTRYRGYGLGHVEHSWRMVCAGFGGRTDPADADTPTYFLLRSAIGVDGEVSSRDDGSVARNHALFHRIRHDGMHRWAWRTDDEMRQFLAEMDAAEATLPEISPFDAAQVTRHGDRHRPHRDAASLQDGAGQDGSLRATPAHLVVDEATTARVRGWAMDLEHPAVPLFLRFLVDGVTVWQGPCGQPRPDVQRLGHPSQAVGFDFALPASIAVKGQRVLTIRNAAGALQRMLVDARACSETVLSLPAPPGLPQAFGPPHGAATGA